jgi:hypothetical protein
MGVDLKDFAGELHQRLRQHQTKAKVLLQGDKTGGRQQQTFLYASSTSLIASHGQRLACVRREMLSERGALPWRANFISWKR